MNKLTIQDLTYEESADTYGYRYFKVLNNGWEISIERCLNGYDVALYDGNLDLIGEKICTNVPDANGVNLIRQAEIFFKALEIANELLKDR